MSGERSEPVDRAGGSGSGERRSGAEPANSGGERSEPVRRGTVTAFDEYVGLGVATGEDGIDYPFHCVEIADGSRTIEVGADVTFTPMAKLGRVEAFQVRPRTSRTSEGS